VSVPALRGRVDSSSDELRVRVRLHLRMRMRAWNEEESSEQSGACFGELKSVVDKRGL
jgi:hypothetical protein